MRQGVESTIELPVVLANLSSGIDPKADSLAIVLAAGHGKRIKSETSKMLHEIWGVPTVGRVVAAAAGGLKTDNQVIVVGIKAVEVATRVGKKPGRVFVFQEQQNGTGDAVRCALSESNVYDFTGHIFVFPGDMGLLTSESVAQFQQDFVENDCDMMVLTGRFEGDPADNYYGRIVRVPVKDHLGNEGGADAGKVIEIKEHKDILALKADEIYEVSYRGRTYAFNRRTLLELPEFNTGVYAFKSDKLRAYIDRIETNNVQGEFYITDLISIFKSSNLTVMAAEAHDHRTVLGFNVKSVLKEMEAYARESVYQRLKDLISIADAEDFFIADEVVEEIIDRDRTAGPLDIFIGKGAHIGPGVRLGKGVQIRNHAHLNGEIELHDDVSIHENVRLSTFPNQPMSIGRGSVVFQGDIIKGRVDIGENCRIESSVNITGSDEYPTIIGNNVTLKGTTYVFGSRIEDDVTIEHSVLKRKQIRRVAPPNGDVQPVRYILPEAEGLDALTDL